MKFYIGVDGGGTKTAYALFDENKNVVAEHEGPASNHENMEGSFPEAAGIIADGVKAVAQKGGVDLADVSGMLMGLAGIDHPYQHDAMQEDYVNQMRAMAHDVYAFGLNIDFFPTNFIVQDGLIFYIDYECNP